MYLNILKGICLAKRGHRLTLDLWILVTTGSADLNFDFLFDPMYNPGLSASYLSYLCSLVSKRVVHFYDLCHIYFSL